MNGFETLLESRNPYLRLRPRTKGAMFVLMAVIMLVGATLPLCTGGVPCENGIVPAVNRSQGGVAPLFRFPRRKGRGGRRRRRHEPANVPACYGRYSSHLQDDQTLATQNRSCQEAASRETKIIPNRLIFGDEAVSGTRRNREGLNALLAAAEAGEFNEVYFYSLSRLARESVIGLSIIKRLVRVLGIRVVSVTEGLDTNRPGWEMVAQVLFMQHERYISELSVNVFNGQATNLQNGYAVGDHVFGYSTEAIPGTEFGRRRERCRMRYIIDEIAADWVRRIFHWFVRERRTIAWIVRELNHHGVKKDPRSSKPKYHRQNVVTILSNRKYVGEWPWAESRRVRDPDTGEIFTEDRSEEQTAQYLRQLPELRLIDDETFRLAQELLERNRTTYAGERNELGEFEEGRAGAAPPPNHLLAGLVHCGECGARMHVGRAYGRYLFCPNRARGLCSCKTSLKRELGERLVLEEISKRILADGNWFAEVVRRTNEAWSARQASLPNELRDLESALADVSVRIVRLVDAVERGMSSDPDIGLRLTERREERRELERRLEAARAANRQLPEAPTAEWIRAQFASLSEVLRSQTPAAAEALAGLIDGNITVVVVHPADRKRPYLRGTFRLPRAKASASLLGEPTSPSEEDCDLITIDFIDDGPRIAKSERAWELLQQGVSYEMIAAELSCSDNFVTKLLREAALRRGLPPIDGRSAEVRARRRTPPSAPVEPMTPDVGESAEECGEGETTE